MFLPEIESVIYNADSPVAKIFRKLFQGEWAKWELSIVKVADSPQRYRGHGDYAES